MNLIRYRTDREQTRSFYKYTPCENVSCIKQALHRRSSTSTSFLLNLKCIMWLWPRSPLARPLQYLEEKGEGRWKKSPGLFMGRKGVIFNWLKIFTEKFASDSFLILPCLCSLTAEYWFSFWGVNLQIFAQRRHLELRITGRSHVSQVNIWKSDRGLFDVSETGDR